MVSKTREKLIDVARQLFMKKGVENTTMNDIAEASEKGRRTIYTYFKNKREIYNAVIEQQSELLLHELRKVAEAPLSPIEKLEQYLTLRFKLIDDINSRNERSRFSLRGDHRRFDKVLRKAMDKELTILRAMMEEGVTQGVFDPGQARRLPSLQIMLSHGIYLPRPADTSATDLSTDNIRQNIIDFIIEGIKLNNQ